MNKNYKVILFKGRGRRNLYAIYLKKFIYGGIIIKMIKRKKLLAIIFALCCLFTMNITVFASSINNSGSLTTQVRHVEINAYGGTFSYERCVSDNNWVSESSEVWGSDLEQGVSFKDRTSGFLRAVSNPTRANAEFEGWLEFEAVKSTEHPGYDYALISDTIYTTEEMMNKAIPEYDVVYFAKWKHIPIASYFKTQSVQFLANGGTMDVISYGQASSGQEEWWLGCYEGNSVTMSGVTISDPVYWTTDRAFEGWHVGKMVEKQNDDGGTRIEFEQLPGTGLLTTAEALAYQIPGHTTVFQAQWKGNDSDYYSQVYINGYEREITVEYLNWENNQPVWKEEKWSVIGDYLKENGQSFGSQTADWLRFKAEPTKEGAVLEGWAEFYVIEKTDPSGSVHEEYELVSNKIYTTKEMLEKAIPEYDVAYVAKWSDIPLELYYKSFAEVALTGNGGDFTYDAIDEDGNAMIGIAPTWGYGMIEGQSINDIDLQSNEVHFKALEKPYSKHTGWTFYECEYYEMIEVPVGTSYTVNDSNAVTYYFDTIINEADVKMDRYIVLWYPTLIDQDMTTEELFAYKCTKSYYGVANWKEEEWTFQDTALEENEYTLGAMELVAVPETVKHKFASSEDIKVALADEFKKHFGNPENVTTQELDIEMFVMKNGKLEMLSDEEFHKEQELQGGVEVCIKFDSFSDQITILNAGKYEFAISHMITSEYDGREPGLIEVFKGNSIRIDEQGLWVRLNSLSPVAVTYWEKETSGGVDGIPAPSVKDETSSDKTTTTAESKPVEVHYAAAPITAKVAPTGDASMPMVFVCVMIASAAVMLCMYRKKNN